MLSVHRILYEGKNYVSRPFLVRAIPAESPLAVKISDSQILKVPPNHVVFVDLFSRKCDFLPKDVFHQLYLPYDYLKRGLMICRDKDRSILNLTQIAKYFIRIGQAGDTTIFIEQSVNGTVHKFFLNYTSAEVMKADKEFLEKLIMWIRSGSEVLKHVCKDCEEG